MPTLPTLPSANNKQIYIPATAVDSQGNPVPKEEQGWVIMDCSPYGVRDYIYSNTEDETNPKEVSYAMFVERIKEWNFEDNGKKFPITKDNVLRLLSYGQGTYSYLLSQIEKSPDATLSTAEKKT